MRCAFWVECVVGNYQFWWCRRARLKNILYYSMYDEGIHSALRVEEVFNLFGFSVTNTLLMSWLVMVVLIVIGLYVGAHLRKIPGSVQAFFETVFAVSLEYLAEVFGSRVLALRYFPVLATMFLFILLGSWSGVLPGIGAIYVAQDPMYTAEVTEKPENPLFTASHTTDALMSEESHLVSLFHPLATDMNVPLAFVLVSFVAFVSGVLYAGFFTFLRNCIHGASLAEFYSSLVASLARLARLTTRSFYLLGGKVFAGKLLLLVVVLFLPYVLPVPFLLYEVFLGFVQAVVLTLLTLVFVKFAVAGVR